MPEPEVRMVLITAPDAEVGEQLARALVAERLAACVNLVPGIRSFYRWEGEIRDDAEVLLIAKTRADRCRALAARIKDLHPYDLPEVLEFSAENGDTAYLEWVRSESAK